MTEMQHGRRQNCIEDKTHSAHVRNGPCYRRFANILEPLTWVTFSRLLGTGLPRTLTTEGE